MAAKVRLGKISDLYLRYIGSLGNQLHTTQGQNGSTHVAAVCMDPEKPLEAGRSIVKFFHLSDKGWFNEYAAWRLAQALGVPVPPYAALLVGKRTDITPGHGPELNAAVADTGTPVVLWCTSALEPHKNIQTALGRQWESAVLKTAPGQHIAAMDGWLGNCDRIASNLLWWVSEGGAFTAIDHEKAAFNVDWTLTNVPHLDEPGASGRKPAINTHLINHIQSALRSKDKTTRNAAKKMASIMVIISKNHTPAWNAIRAELAQEACNNFGAQACDRLLSFLDYRVTEDSINRRLGLVI